MGEPVERGAKRSETEYHYSEQERTRRAYHPNPETKPDLQELSILCLAIEQRPVRVREASPLCKLVCHIPPSYPPNSLDQNPRRRSASSASKRSALSRS